MATILQISLPLAATTYPVNAEAELLHFQHVPQGKAKQKYEDGREELLNPRGNGHAARDVGHGVAPISLHAIKAPEGSMSAVAATVEYDEGVVIGDAER